MISVLGQLSIAIGGLMFIVVMIIGLANDVPVYLAVFRAIIVMCVTSVVMALFFRFFTNMVYRFVAEQVLQQNRDKKQKAGPGGEGSTGP